MIRIVRPNAELDNLAAKHLNGVKPKVLSKLLWIKYFIACRANMVVGTAPTQKLFAKTKWLLLRQINISLGAKKNAKNADILLETTRLLTAPATSIRQVVLNHGNNVITILDYILKNIDVILSGKPRRIIAIERIISKYCRSWVATEQIEFRDILPLIFNYDGWSNLKKNRVGAWTPYNLADGYHIKVCPYCNRQYTSTITTKNGVGIIRPEFDHFFCQSKYPLLGLSFYNLIPSCTSCNSRLKGDKDFKLISHMHPLFEGFGDKVRFSYSYVNTLDSLEEIEKGVIITMTDPQPNSTVKRKSEKHRADFSIETIYQEHRDIVSELIVMAEKYPPSLLADFKRDMGLKFAKDDVARLFLGNYVNIDHLEKRPLAKLTRDICLELGMIDNSGALSHGHP